MLYPYGTHPPRMTRLLTALILRALGLRLPGDVELDELERHLDTIIAANQNASA